MAECPKLASKLRLTNTDIIKCQQLMYNDVWYATSLVNSKVRIVLQFKCQK